MDGLKLNPTPRNVHRTVWVESHGIIPTGYLVHHINGDGMDNHLENLELISRPDHCALHLPRLGYRAPIKTICSVCGNPRGEKEIKTEPYRRKCNHRRRAEYLEKVK